MRSHHRSNGVGPYVVLGGVGILLLAIGVLIFALRGRVFALFARDRVAASSENAATDSSSSEKKSGWEPTNPPVVVRSDDLRQKYADDESTADGMYKDRVVEITGTISNVLYENSTGVI